MGGLARQAQRAHAVRTLQHMKHEIIYEGAFVMRARPDLHALVPEVREGASAKDAQGTTDKEEQQLQQQVGAAMAYSMLAVYRMELRNVVFIRKVNPWGEGVAHGGGVTFLPRNYRAVRTTLLALGINLSTNN